VGDFNGDGKLDIAAAVGGSNLLVILLGDGDGTFTAATSPTSTLDGPGSLAVADFNGDGFPDIAVVNGGNDTLSILLSRGDGTFNAQSRSLPSGSSAWTLTTGDFNGDGKSDLAVTNALTHSTVQILLGNGDGTFTNGTNPSTGGPDA